MRLIILLMCVNVAQAAVTVSLNKAIKMALRTSEEVQIRKGEEEKSKYQYFEAKAALLPSLSYEASWNANFDIPTAGELNEPSVSINPGAGVMPVSNKYQMSHQIQMTQPVFTFGKIYHGIGAARLAYKSSKYGVDATKREVIYNTKVAYYSVLLSQSLLDIRKNSLRNASHNKGLLKKRFSRGRPPQSDIIKMAADVATRVPQVKDAEVNLESASLNLKMILGIDSAKELQLSDQMKEHFKDFDYQELNELMKKSEPRLKMLNAAVSASDEMVKQKKSNFLPTLAAFANYKYWGSGNDAYVGGSEMGDLWTVGLSLNFPIWSGGQKISQYKYAVADRSAAQAQKRQLEKGLNLQLRNAYSQYKMYLATYRSNLEAERLAKQSFRMSQNRFRTGNTSISELNDVEMQLTGAKMQKVLTLYNIYQVNALIEMLTVE